MTDNKIPDDFDWKLIFDPDWEMPDDFDLEIPDDFDWEEAFGADWDSDLDSKLLCDDCGYESIGFIIHPYGSPYCCDNCHKVVFASDEHFYFIPPRCPECQIRFKRENMINVWRMGEDDRVRCPVCGNQSLRLKKSLSDCTIEQCSVLVPEQGSIIHGWVSEYTSSPDSKSLTVPGVGLHLLEELRIDPAGLDSLPCGKHKFEVLYASEQMFHLRWLGELTEKDCVELIKSLDG